MEQTQVHPQSTCKTILFTTTLCCVALHYIFHEFNPVHPVRKGRQKSYTYMVQQQADTSRALDKHPAELTNLVKHFTLVQFTLWISINCAL